jgi:hypothetical protein
VGLVTAHGPMTYYRLYFIDAFTGHIGEFREFEAENDGAAMALAEEWRSLSAMELWCRSRKVRQWDSVSTSGSHSRPTAPNSA